MTSRIPSYVPENRVFKLNIYEDERLQGDLHEALTTLHRDAPSIFWTPENGGHWVITRYDLMDEVLRDPQRFSSSGNRSPNVPNAIPQIPINLDPPEHTYYRRILMRHFGTPAINKLVPRIEHWARTLVGDVAGQGHCEFMDEVGSLFPVSIFMEMMGLPLERLREYRALVVEFFGFCTPQRYVELQNEIMGQMREVLLARQLEPRDDMATALQSDDFEGRRMTMGELENLTNLLFQAGMDTVANFAGFFFRYLGTRPELQRLIREQPEQIPQIVEEGFRLFGVVNVGREVRKDLTLAGVEMRAGDIIICMLPLGGLDEARNPEPTSFRIDRADRAHMLFSRGVHMCVGRTLAKVEMQVLLKEWFQRIPEFRIAEGYVPEFRAGQVMGLAHLPLEWAPAR
jgi:cytochrome P450